jgi:predicted PhzF superfamily epimerase YddE/YHI9
VAAGVPSWHGFEQQIATHLGFSETVFIDSPAGPDSSPRAAADSARLPRAAASIRIFTPASELPFAGHPTVGTAWWLRERGTPADVLLVPAGEVGVRFEGDVAWVSARASWAPDFDWIPLDSPSDVDALRAGDFVSGQHYAYAWIDETAGILRARMFAPAMGIAEDEATGAAAVALTARLGRDLDISQGEGSRIATRHLPDGIVEVGGKVVTDRGVNVHIQ